jgi:hypothetical protein
MNTELLTLITTALIRNLDYHLKYDLVMGGMEAVELEKTSNPQEGAHLIIFDLNADTPLEYIVAQTKTENAFDQEVRKMLIETNVNAEISKVLKSL